MLHCTPKGADVFPGVRWSLGVLVLVAACAQSVTPDDVGVDAPSPDASTDASEPDDAGADAGPGCPSATPTVAALAALGGSGLEVITAVAANPIDATFAVAGHFDGDAFGTSPAAASQNAFHLTLRSSAGSVTTSALRVYTSSTGSELLDAFIDPHGSVTLGGALIGGTAIVERSPIDTGTTDPSGVVVRLVNGMAPSVHVLTVASGVVRVNATSRRGDGYYVAGEVLGDLTVGSQRCTSSDLDGFIAAFTFEGSLDWLRCFGGPGDQRVRGIAMHDAGEAYVVGDFRTSITLDGIDTIAARGGSDAFAARFSGSGAPLWIQAIGTTGASPDDSLARVVVSGSRVLAVGTLGSGDVGLVSADPPLGGLDGALVALDLVAGDVLRIARFGDAADDELRDIAVDRCGRAWIVGLVANAFGPTFIRAIDVQTMSLGYGPELDPHDLLLPSAVAVSDDGASVLVGGTYQGAPTLAGATLPMAQGPSDLFVMTIAR
jgi:hypothetical protein